MHPKIVFRIGNKPAKVRVIILTDICARRPSGKRHPISRPIKFNMQEDSAMQQIARTSYGYLIGAAIAFGPALQAQPASAGFIQQGPKLVATETLGVLQGSSVALSGDGKTAIVGAPDYANGGGAAWVFTLSNGAWQKGQELVGTGAIGAAQQGRSAALSADGNTAIIGGPADQGLGAAWVFTRSNGVWTQQGHKLPWGDGVGSLGPKQGISVALSADGNTAIAGGPDDATQHGAAWVWIRVNGIWSEQGKLVGNSPSGGQQGFSVALSADGNTALVGAPTESSSVGAAWVFTRSNGIWTQQGGKLFGTDAHPGTVHQGNSVALSADGNTALVGGPEDNNSVGAAWVFTRSNGIWTQRGGKLVATDVVFTNARQGWAVALSADGNTAFVSGPNDNFFAGAVWRFTRNGSGNWSQQGQKLVGAAAIGDAFQGYSVALSADARTAMVGGDGDNYNSGAAWVFFQSNAATHDFNGDGFSDIAWRDTGGNTALWMMDGAQVAQFGSLGTVPTNWVIAGQRDYNGDGTSDLLWRDTNSGGVAIWALNGAQIVQTASLGPVATSWSIVGTGDFNGDGLADILWRNSSGTVALWLMNFSQVAQSGTLGSVPTTWTVVGTGDFNGDGKTDILWRDASGNVAVWLMNGLQVLQAGGLSQIAATWSVVGTGDFNGDGNYDVLWRDSSGNVAVWLMNGLQMPQPAWLGMVPLNWSVAETGDFDRDGKSDILWRDTSTGAAAIWFMNGGQVSQSAGVAAVATTWTIQGLNAD
jgi:hypothetical protein